MDKQFCNCKEAANDVDKRLGMVNLLQVKVFRQGCLKLLPFPQRISAPIIPRKKIPPATPCFKVQKFNEAILYMVCRKQKSDIQEGSSQTGIIKYQFVHNLAAKYLRQYPIEACALVS